MKNTTSSLLTLSLLLFLSLPTPSLSAERCNPHDKKVLLQIKQSFNNPYILASWVPTYDCCDWYVVECDRTTNRINSLTLFGGVQGGGNLSGQIPAAVGDLPFLETLILHKLSNLTGPIPPAIAKLSHLKTLWLSWTNLTGPVPSFLSQLKNLTFLDLSFNDLTGSVPMELSLLKNLAGIRLDRNKLTGPIPDWRFMGNAPDINLSHNKLTGQIPESFGYYNYTRLDFSRNMLSGDLSFMFGSNKTVQIVDFSRNTFEFNMSSVVFPASLTSLDLNHNRIFGSLPVGLTALQFQFLNVSYNRLCGKIPMGGKLQNFDATSYFHNRKNPSCFNSSTVRSLLYTAVSFKELRWLSQGRSAGVVMLRGSYRGVLGMTLSVFKNIEGPLEAEAEALELGMFVGSRLGVGRAIFEVDNGEVASYLRSRRDIPPDLFLKFMNFPIHLFEDYDVNHILREGNQVADVLAGLYRGGKLYSHFYISRLILAFTKHYMDRDRINRYTFFRYRPKKQGNKTIMNV
ncbi:hypothetical protein RHGRI_006292 [Rhododendron griersonianum]|uniref:Leucine-rich repeat-containing N-terminal plant-type domain-containing protein n=1 Tax=Rhododendron griersonianum TaxID=479676 RepID=A0AAV6KTX6_9ERIC|nr:hypothetical protein RHGRI_006292 [Rhododendron griersonianum]